MAADDSEDAGGTWLEVHRPDTGGAGYSVWSPSVHCKSDSGAATWRNDLGLASGVSQSRPWSAPRGLHWRVSALTRSSEIPSLRGEAGTAPAETRSYPCSDPRHGVEQSQEGTYRGTRIGQHERTGGVKEVHPVENWAPSALPVLSSSSPAQYWFARNCGCIGDPTNQRASTVESTNNEENEIGC